MSSWLQRGLFARKRSSSIASTTTQQTDEPKSPVVASNSGPTDGKAQQQQQTRDLEEDYAEGDIGPLPSDKELEDVNAMFTRLSVAEMRRYDQRLQRHMEHMRQQMRKVATDHYPELIDAADSVVAMDNLSASISMQMSSLRGMLESAQIAGCSRAPAAAQTPGQPSMDRDRSSNSSSSSDDAREKMYAVAAQVKVLVDTPELIWKALAARHFLQATLLYLIAREIHGRLAARGDAAASEEQGDAVDPMLAFPVIERMWTTIAPLAAQIADKGRQILSDSDSVSTEACMSAICAIALLEDVDAEVASAEFLARRSEALWPLLARIEARQDGDELEERLCELLGHIHQIVADYVLIFGVPEDPGAGAGDYASWMVTTLASICADAELSLHPSLQLLWDGWPSTADSMQAAKTAPPLSSRRSEMQSLKARRRKSSIAGSVLSSAVITGASPLASAQSPTTPKIGTQAFSDTRRPWRPAAAQGGLATLSSNVIVARYLPPAVARFCPPLARILDVQWEAEGYTLDEADEEQDMQGLAQYLGNPRALTRALSTHVQPIVERCARRSLQLWWRRTAERLQMSLARAVSQRIAQVADATRVSRALAAWEADMREDRQWARGFAWGAIAGNALAQDVALQSLHRSLVEPLLRVRASELQRAQVESALALADAFVESDADIHAGHLPWHALGDATPSSLSSSSAAAAGTALRELSADVRGSLVFLPTGVRELETRVFAGIEGAWVDAQAWWAQLSGATAAPEALACAQHFGQQWDLLVERLERWADACMAAKPADEALAARCIRGAWATVALASVSRQALAAADAQLVCACWQEAGVDEDRLVRRLRRVGQALLQPWQHVLGRGLASAWAQQFDALYYRVPGSLRADAVATRQDVVCAWRRVAPADAPWATRYAALRRLATAAACDGRAKAAPSQAVRRLVVALRAQVQAVGGLSAVSAGLLDGQLAMRRRIGAAAGAELAAAVQGKRAQAGGASEWDGRQIAADIRFVLHETLGVDDDTVAALVSECTQALACSAS